MKIVDRKKSYFEEIFLTVQDTIKTKNGTGYTMLRVCTHRVLKTSLEYLQPWHTLNNSTHKQTYV